MGLGHGFGSLSLFTFSGQFVLPALPREYEGFDLHILKFQVRKLWELGPPCSLGLAARVEKEKRG